MRDASRYDHNWYQNEMEQCENGDYVHHSDYATLRAENERLKGEVERVMEETAGMVDCG